MDIFNELVQAIVANMSTEMKTWACTQLAIWKTQAEGTSSPWDDIMVLILQRLFNCPT